MRRIFLTIALVVIALSSNTLAKKPMKEHPDRKDVDGIEREDPEMLAANKKARESLMTFVRALGKREKGKRYLLKVTLKEGDTVEHVWLEPVRWNDPGLLGVLAVDPVEIKKHKKGDVIYPLPADVSDWLILSEDGTKEGGFTADVIEKRRAAAKKGKPEGAGASAAESESESGEKEKPEGGEKEKPEEKSDGSSR